MMISVFDRIENILGKGQNAGYQYFFPFLTMFTKGFFLGVVKSLDCVVELSFATAYTVYIGNLSAITMPSIL